MIYCSDHKPGLYNLKAMPEKKNPNLIVHIFICPVMVNLIYFVMNVKPLKLKTNRMRAYSELKSTKHVFIVCRLVGGGTAITTISCPNFNPVWK